MCRGAQYTGCNVKETQLSGIPGALFVPNARSRVWLPQLRFHRVHGMVSLSPNLC